MSKKPIARRFGARATTAEESVAVPTVEDLRVSIDEREREIKRLRSDMEAKDKEITNLEGKLDEKDLKEAAATFGLEDVVGHNVEEDLHTMVDTARTMINDYKALRSSAAWRSGTHGVGHKARLVLLGMRGTLKQLGFDKILGVEDAYVPDTLQETISLSPVLAASGLNMKSRAKTAAAVKGL